MATLQLQDKKIAVLGLGLTGLSCLHFLLSKGLNVIALDSRNDIQLDIAAPLYLGQFDLSLLLKQDVLVLSPGIDLATPAIVKAREAGLTIIGDIELYAQYNLTPVVSITGSNGKSTVTSLLAHIINEGGKKALMGGNIGVPALELLGQKADLHVLELSSFQLESTDSLRPCVATVLNVTDDHLDRHKSIDNYRAIKLKVYQGAKHCVYNRDDKLTFGSASPAMTFGLSSHAKDFSWDCEQQAILLQGKPYLAMNECLLFGEHNVLNIQAAAAMAMQIGIAHDDIKRAVRSFKGLSHRCETVALRNGVRWINDSKATNVGATRAAISGLAKVSTGKLILIAGGEGKGADFSSLGPVFEQYVSALITLGKDGHRLAELIAPSSSVMSYQVDTLNDAVQRADALVSQGDVVLLSPACASLDMFKDYQHRGECFIQAVEGMAA